MTDGRVSPTVVGMGLRIGIDLISVADIVDALESHGDRYLQRVFTRREVDDCRVPGGGIDPQRLAARFAAKEAVLKALRIDPSAGLALTSVEITTGRLGDPEVVLAPDAAKLAAAAEVGEFSVSLTHEGAYAAAVVIAATPGNGA